MHHLFVLFFLILNFSLYTFKEEIEVIKKNTYLKRKSFAKEKKEINKN
jgi:hypothetical protein